MIPYGRQTIEQQDIDEVVNVLKSDFLTQGTKVPEFELAVAKYCGASHAVAVNSATSALHIACLSLGLGKGDWLWTSPITFVASANCGLYCGAKVDFVDIDSKTNNICPVALEHKLKLAAQNGTLPKVVVLVHFSGQPCDLKTIFQLSKIYGFRIIEDASHAIGGKYDGDAIGNCQYSDITVFSFHPVKIMTTGEGGIAATNDNELAKNMELLRSHGVTRDPELMTQDPDGPWYYQQIDLGFNYRITEIQAALGISQIKRIDTFVARRHEIAEYYDTHLENLPLQLPYQESFSFSAWHLYVIRLDLSCINKTHKQVFEALREKGIGVNLHYIPVYSQPFFKKMGFDKALFPQAEAYYQEAISIPIYYSLTQEEQDYIIESLRLVLK